ncbi:MAG TPA: SCO family protein [Vicinamibacterales bacterium]|nr:SCO family protein [Vicinamibacterales bacterium]
MNSCRNDVRGGRLATGAAAGALALLALAVGHAGSVAFAAGPARFGAEYFTNVALTTHEGKTVRFFDDLIKGKIVAINLIYTTCQYACPLETARLAQVQRLLGDRMGRDVFFYSITIDPDHDTPAVLNEYARKYGAGPGWLFLTGSRSDIDALSRRLGLYAPLDPDDPDGHLPYLLVGNQATGQWMRNTAVDNPKFLARTIGSWLSGWRASDGPGLKSLAEARPIEFATGQYTFAYHCAACHTIGGGTLIGPDLDGVVARRDRAWLRQFIVAPEKMNARGDATAIALRKAYLPARMPNLDLSDDEVAGVIEYLEQQNGARRVAKPEAAPTPKAMSAVAAAGARQPIFDAYLRVQQALYSDTLESVGDAARAIERDAAALGAAGDALRSAASGFADATDLKGARAAFATLSDAMLAFIRSSGSSEPLTIAFCPMAQKFWVQRGERIQNPYYGKAMPDCGRVSTSK